MTTATRLRLGPKEAGTALALEDFLAANFVEGFRYELIDGRLTVSPAAGLPHDQLETFMMYILWRYAERYPNVINYVSAKARVFLPAALHTTCPEPDLAAYHNMPKFVSGIDWRQCSPLLVIEILSPDNADKDLERNVDLYFQVPSIKEYWVVDGITEESRPSMKVYRRWGQKWRIIDVPFDNTYTTRLLPGFELRMNPFVS